MSKLIQNGLQPLQVARTSGWTGLTTENHLASIGYRSPQLLADFMVNLVSRNSKGSNLEAFLRKFPIKYVETTNDYEWDVVGGYRRNIPLIQARDESGAIIDENYGNVGRNFSPFYLVFPEDYFFKGEIIMGEKNEVYPLHIQDHPVNEGSQVVYRVVLANGDENGIPAREVLEGRRFSYSHTIIESEMSRSVGGIRFGEANRMRNNFTNIRLDYKVASERFVKENSGMMFLYPFIDPDNGNKVEIKEAWVHYTEWLAEIQFREMKANMLAYGRSTKGANGEFTLFGASGNKIKTGAGLYEQISYGNQHYYTKFNIEMFERALVDFSVDNKEFGERKYILRTGEYGAIAFHKAVSDSVKGWAYIGDGNAPAVTRTNSPYHDNAMSAGYQFTEYRAPNGVTITLDIDSMYDDIVRNKISHPQGGTAFSHRFDLFDCGTTDNPNIQLVQPKGAEEHRSVIVGTTRYNVAGTLMSHALSAYGGGSYQHSANDEDSVQFTRTATMGVCVRDASRVMSFIPSILRD